MLVLTLKIYFSLKVDNSNQIVMLIYLSIYKTNTENEIYKI